MAMALLGKDEVVQMLRKNIVLKFSTHSKFGQKLDQNSARLGQN